MPSPGELFSLHGRTALVTGGSRGLGLEIAQGLGESGARVAIAARRREWLDDALRSLQSVGIDALAITGDVADPAATGRMVDEITAAFGRIDILVNAAGRTWGAPSVEMPLERWHEVMPRGSFPRACPRRSSPWPARGWMPGFPWDGSGKPANSKARRSSWRRMRRVTSPDRSSR